MLARLAARDDRRPPASGSRVARRGDADDRRSTTCCYFQAEDKYTKVVTAAGEALIRKPIKELFEELDPEAFWQIHRAHDRQPARDRRVERDWRDQPVISLQATGREKLTVSPHVRARFKAMWRRRGADRERRARKPGAAQAASR